MWKFEAGERRVENLEFIEIAKALGADPVGLFLRLFRLAQTNRLLVSSNLLYLFDSLKQSISGARFSAVSVHCIAVGRRYVLPAIAPVYSHSHSRSGDEP